MEKREYIKSKGTPALMPVLAMAFGRASMTCPICRCNSNCKLARWQVPESSNGSTADPMWAGMNLRFSKLETVYIFGKCT